MSFEIITMWYNEEYLAPFFLKHYSWAEKISLLYDDDSTDNTLDIVRLYPNVQIIHFRFPDMMDDDINQDYINNQYHQAECDWVLAVDADEFVFYKEREEFVYNLEEFVSKNMQYDIFIATLYQIYRNKIDSDLNPSLPPVPQRRYGDPNVTDGINKLYNKPILLRKGMYASWRHGCHHITAEGARFCPEKLLGAHWSMADPAFSVERRVKNRRARQSRHNLEKQLTVQHHHVTVKSIMAEFACHSDDPRVF
jgi:hypothetical protein